MSEMTSRAAALLNQLGVRLPLSAPGGPVIAVRSPIDGAVLAELPVHSDDWVNQAARRAQSAFTRWARVPAPLRGELVRVLGAVLREHKSALAALVSIEAGKIPSEAAGEVQEMIDICDFAVGLSRQLHGLTIASERPEHRMMEQWLPLGPVGVITAFNFPVAVWSWNAALALVCGSPVIWKPSEKTPLTALAVHALFGMACGRYAETRGSDAEERGMLADLVQVGLGRASMGRAIADHSAIALVSATGSTRMGLDLAPRVAARLGRSLLELGGNNAVIVAPTADLNLALRGLVFGAWGTAGQRCTTTRRLIVHEAVCERLLEALERARRSLPVGSPFDPGTLVGPLVDAHAFEAMQSALARARADGGLISGGERRLEDRFPRAWYAAPALARMPSQTSVVRDETFAPILYAITYDTLDEAIALNNDVPQGLSSSIFTRDLQEAERFLSAGGSDCGIANVNLGTSGAEIGGAFGGDKQTGGGRESGSDAWKAYMRRATNTVNYGARLPLAQGVVFDIGDA